MTKITDREPHLPSTQITPADEIEAFYVSVVHERRAVGGLVSSRPVAGGVGFGAKDRMSRSRAAASHEREKGTHMVPDRGETRPGPSAAVPRVSQRRFVGFGLRPRSNRGDGVRRRVSTRSSARRPRPEPISESW